MELRYSYFSNFPKLKPEWGACELKEGNAIMRMRWLLQSKGEMKRNLVSGNETNSTVGRKKYQCSMMKMIWVRKERIDQRPLKVFD